MPIYTNTTGQAITPVGGQTVPPGGTLSVAEYLKDPAGLTLTKHTKPGSCMKILSATSPGVSGIMVYGYDKITVFNQSDKLIKVYPNAQDANYWPVPAGKELEIDNEVKGRNWHQIATVGEGSGTVYIVASDS